MRPILALLLLGCGTNVVVGDAGSDATVMNVDITGSWHDCRSSVTFAPDGSASGLDHVSGCTREGTWRMLEPDLVETTMTGGTCEIDPEPDVARVFLGDGGLTFVDPETASAHRLADDDTPRGIWLLEGVEGMVMGSSTASVVGNPEEGFGSGCYWSTDGECGGLFSCSGAVLVWETEGTRFSAFTGCSGGCPCGSVLEGSVEADGTLSADFRGVNCDRSFEGTLTGVRVGP